ncbi:hypothetical protein CKY47_31505 [Saccharothrix yanglingensis]|uniref:Uncharacterized protein n=1 Tax=Saccharothrix yanglingensis TaxID=659496 RepID=A0ABU0X8E7_9PSEU|nr:hypothetical protein [Saccharothrix yanglingensis]
MFHGFAGSAFLVDDPPEYEVGVGEPGVEGVGADEEGVFAGFEDGGAKAMTSPSGVRTAPSRT